MAKKSGYGQFCPVAKAAEIVAERWTLLVLRELILGSRRFNELRRAIKGVSQHMLTMQLRDLEQHGIITRTVFAEVPPRVEYALTEHGETLKSVIRALAGWGHEHLKRKGQRQPSPRARKISAS